MGTVDDASPRSAWGATAWQAVWPLILLTAGSSRPALADEPGTGAARPSHPPPVTRVQPAFPTSLEPLLGRSQELVCKMEVHVALDGRVSELTTPPDGCPRLVSIYAASALSKWRWSPSDVSEPFVYKVVVRFRARTNRTDEVALDEAGVAYLREQHVVGALDGGPCRVDLVVSPQGDVVQRRTNSSNCLAAIGFTAPPPEPGACTLTLRSDWGRSTQVSVADCPKGLRQWAAKATRDTRWADDRDPRPRDYTVTWHVEPSPVDVPEAAP